MSLFNVYPLFDITPVKAKDVYVYDENNTEYLDLYGGHAVISIGHSHPTYVQKIQDQVASMGFYSNSIKNPLQEQLAKKLTELSDCKFYELFLCNSGAEANENAIKLASFHTKREKIVAFKNSFHGRTSAAVAATDNPKIVAPVNAQQKVEFLEFGDIDGLATILAEGDVCAVITEIIQGVGGLDEATTKFYQTVNDLCKQSGTIFIADEVQSGFGRTGDFFAFQKHQIEPDIISIAKGMGNGFPIGGILIAPHIQSKYGLLGTTFGGNHLACAACIAVLEVLEKESLIEKANLMGEYFMSIATQIPGVKQVKGRGLMLGLEFDYEVGELRKKLIYDKQMFTGGAKNKKLLRILPPLTIDKEQIDAFVTAVSEVVAEEVN